MATQDPRLIRLVAARYQQMQGLRTMADSLSLLLLATGLSLATAPWHIGVSGLIFALYLLLRWTWLNRRIERHYADRFGRTGWSPLVPGDLGLTLGMFFTINSAARDLFHAPAVVRVVLVMTALCIYPLRIAIRDFPHRSYWLLLVALGVGIAIQIPGLPTGDAADYWYRNASLGLGLALFAVGALDHLMLVRALGGGTREADAIAGMRDGA